MRECHDDAATHSELGAYGKPVNIGMFIRERLTVAKRLTINQRYDERRRVGDCCCANRYSHCIRLAQRIAQRADVCVIVGLGSRVANPDCERQRDDKRVTVQDGKCICASKSIPRHLAVRFRQRLLLEVGSAVSESICKLLFIQEPVQVGQRVGQQRGVAECLRHSLDDVRNWPLPVSKLNGIGDA